MFYIKKHLLLIQIIFLLLLTPSHGWWLWGDDSESVTEEVKVVESIDPEPLETDDNIIANSENKIDEVKLVDIIENKTEETFKNIEKQGNEKLSNSIRFSEYASDPDRAPS